MIRQDTEQQRQFAAEVVQGWMDYNARMVWITMHLAQVSVHPFADRFAAGFKNRGTANSAPFEVARLVSEGISRST